VSESAPGVKVAVITGASRGIGAGLAAAFRRTGHAVVATSRSIPSSDEPDFLTVRGDIAEAETAQRVVEQTLGRFGRIDTLINNAGIFLGKPFTDYTLDDYAKVTAVNLAGFFHITQLGIRQMVSQGSGHVVNITASLVDHPEREAPAALASLTKGGLAAATRSLAAEYASQGVRVNAVAPGPVSGTGEIDDIVQAIMYLEQATFITGETLHVDGGQASGGSVSS
jgi:NAD(P)-dependent dehydrogenase (short-subunit alcohol dehydrogenase family)